MNLFVTPPAIDLVEFLGAVEAQKSASYKLSSPPSYWDDEVAQTLIREHPYIPSDRLIVTFKQKDDTEGTAYGFATLAGNEHLSIPVVINRRQLSPMDVLIIRTNRGADTEQATGDMDEDRVVPLNDATFNAALEGGDIGSIVEPHEEAGTGYTEDGTSMRLPFRGRTVLAEYLGASAAKQAEFQALLSKDKEIVAGFLMNGTGDVVSSWLNAAEPAKLAQKKLASLTKDLSIVSYLTETPVEKKTAEFLAADIVVEDGTIKTAVAVDAVDLAAPTKGASRILVFEDGTYCSAPAAVATFGKTAEDAATRRVLKKIASRELRRGSTIMLQVGDNFTRPAKLAAIAANDQDGMVRFALLDDLNREYNVFLSNRAKTASFNGSAWILPMNAAVFQLDSSDTAVAMAPEKVAQWFERQLPDALTHHNGQFTLTIRGETFGAPQAPEAKIAEVLDSWFVNGSALITQAKTAGHVRFASQLQSQVAGLVKMAENCNRLPDLGKLAVEEIGMPLAAALKLASGIGDPEGADAVLSAGFLSEDNVAEFANLHDQFEEVVSKLARLLLAIRMGFPGDENATMVAMKSLQRVVERLRAASESLG